MISDVGGERLRQMVLISGEKEGFCHCEENDLRFEGHFAVVTFGADDALRSVYIGHGRELSVGGRTFRPTEGDNLYVSAVD